MGTTDFTPGELCEKLGMDGFGYQFPTGQKVAVCFRPEFHASQ